MWSRQSFFIGWDLLYCSFSIYLRYHPDGLGGSVKHCTVNLSILHPYLINSSFTVKIANIEPLNSNKAVSQPLCSIVTDNVNTSSLWEFKRQLNKWTKRRSNISNATLRLATIRLASYTLPILGWKYSCNILNVRSLFLVHVFRTDCTYFVLHKYITCTAHHWTFGYRKWRVFRLLASFAV